MLDACSAAKVSRISNSSSSSLLLKDENRVVQVDLTLLRRNQSRIAFWRILWNSIGSSSGGRSAYFSDSRSMESCTTSSAESSSLTAKTACLNALRSTEAKKSESSCREARIYLVSMFSLLWALLLPDACMQGTRGNRRANRQRLEPIIGGPKAV